MLRHDDRYGHAVRQLRQDCLKSLWAAGARADKANTRVDAGDARRPPQGRLDGSCWLRRYGAGFVGTRFGGCQKLVVDAVYAAGFRNEVDGAKRERFECNGGALLGTRRQHDDGGRALLDDLLQRLDAVHHRMSMSRVTMSGLRERVFSIASLPF